LAVILNYSYDERTYEYPNAVPVLRACPTFYVMRATLAKFDLPAGKVKFGKQNE